MSPCGSSTRTSSGRYLLNDDPEPSPACLALFRDLESGRLKAWTSELVIAELVFVLSSRSLYDLPREAIRDLLLPLIQLAGLRVDGKRLYQRVFELYVSSPIDFVDAYHAAHILRTPPSELYSYDADFDRVEGVRRLEPAPPLPDTQADQP